MTRDADSALHALLMLLAKRGYDFVTPTPASHARVIARPRMERASDLRGLLGWSLPLAPDTVDPHVEDLLRQAGMIERVQGGLLKSRLRVSRLHGKLFLHSAFPTDAQDAVFFGPDSYRFADLIAAELKRAPLKPGSQIVDLGAGSGVGGIVASQASRSARTILVDLNPKALRLARINARAAGVEVETVEAEDMSGISAPTDLAVINPPYIIDDSNRAYRDGGDMHGGQVPLDMARMAAERLAPGGRVLLYTGAAIVGGRSALGEALHDLARAHGLRFDYREMDVDVFGEELAKPAYADVERIALIAATLTRPL